MTRRPRQMPFSRLVIRYWLPAILYVAVIFFVSAQPRLRPPAPFAHVDKVYHAIEYLLLGLLLARAFRGLLPGHRPLVLALLALSIGVMIGTADELFQSTVPGRDSSALDLLADTGGLVLAQLIFLSITRDPLMVRD